MFHIPNALVFRWIETARLDCVTVTLTSYLLSAISPQFTFLPHCSQDILHTSHAPPTSHSPCCSKNTLCQSSHSTWNTLSDHTPQAILHPTHSQSTFDNYHAPHASHSQSTLNTSHSPPASHSGINRGTLFEKAEEVSW